MSGILASEDREIGGNIYTVRMLSVREARTVYARVQRYLFAWGDDDAKALGPIMMAGLGGLVQEADLDYLCDVFGKETSVQVGDRVIHLKVDKTPAGSKSPGQDELFAGNFEHLLEWLDFAIEANFKGVIAKLKGAQELVASKGSPSAPKAQPIA